MQNTEKKLLKEKFEYFFKDKLGSGSFAEVYKGRTIDTNEELAIKIISKQGIKKYGEDILRAIGQEVTILQKISYSITSPFIIKIFDCFQTDNNIYMVLEFCNQGTLDDILKKKKKLEEKEAKIIIYQVLCALDLLAENDIAHRDIKPENIFISNGIYKLGDFGTYPYMAPEMFKNSDYTKSVDVWALGVMYHQMLFGELYFIGKNHLQVADNIQKKEYIIPNTIQISKESKDVLTKCLIKDEKKRITTKQLKNHPLFADIIDDVNKQVNQAYQIKNTNTNVNNVNNVSALANQNNNYQQQQPQQQQFIQLNQQNQQQQFYQQQQQQIQPQQFNNYSQQQQQFAPFQQLQQQQNYSQVPSLQQQQSQLSPENQKVMLNLNNHLQGCQFLGELAEQLAGNVSMTRFQTHYILKKSLKKYKKLLETLNGLEHQQQQSTQKQMQELLNSSQYKQFKQTLNQQYDLGSLKFEEFTQDLNAFIEKSFMQNSQVLKSVICKDLNQDVPEELYTQELDFLAKEYYQNACAIIAQQQQNNNQVQQNELLVIALMLVVAKNYDNFANNNFQFQQFLNKKSMMNQNELKMLIQNQSAFQQFFKL